MKQTLAAIAIACSLAACGPRAWMAGPDTHATFDEQSAQCRLMARAGDRDFAAVGSLSYVAGAAIGNAVGNAIRGQATFNDCLVAAGWLPLDSRLAP